MAVPVLNELDLMVGALAKLEIAPWITACGATAFETMGALRDMKWKVARETKDVECDNSLEPIGQYPVKSSIEVSGVFVESNLSNLALALGDGTTSTYVDVATAATRDYAVNSLDGGVWYTVRVTIDDQSMAPSTTTFGQRVYTFWRCKFTGDVEQSWSKDDETVVPFTIKAYKDDSSTLGYLFNVVDAA